MSAMTPRKALAWVGHRGREALLLPALLRRARPRVVFLPSHSGKVGSSALRAEQISGALGAQGWNSLCLPAQLEQVQRQRLIAAFRPDLVVVQKCRHPLNRLAHLAGLPLVLDLDDADFHDPAQAPHLEAMARAARGVMAGSHYIRDWAAPLNPNVSVVWTGSALSPGPRPPHATRAPIVSWAQSDPLGYPEELAFIETVLAPVKAAYQLRLYGVNSAAARDKLTALLPFARLQCLPTLAYDRFLVSLRDVAVGLSPIIPASPFSRGKSFGKILGYLDAKVPVICSDEADHARFFTTGFFKTGSFTTGTAPETGVVSNDPEVWRAAVTGLLADPARRDAMAEAAFAGFQARLSLTAAAARVAKVLTRLA